MTTEHSLQPSDKVKDTPATWLMLSPGLDGILSNAKLQAFTSFLPDVETALISECIITILYRGFEFFLKSASPDV